MAYVADLHIHSKYAGACSGALNIPNLSHWAKLKGIDLLGTGDALHPLYQRELQKDLKEENDGIYSHNGVKFIVTAEISCIYSEYGKTRRIHILLFFPSLDSAIKLSEKLTRGGAKLMSDGRPILGTSSKKLCEEVLSVDPRTLIVPAHVWTPWFSLYGSNSGYDHLDECFGEFSDQIYAVETGLSSEPAMNWRIPELDNKSIVSFSDCHSLPRLAREATLFKGDISFTSLTKALKNDGIVGTIEFFPEEGKYHYSGHRNCNVVLDPEQLRKNGEICPVCHRKLTIGVLQRVEELAKRSEAELELIKEDGVTKSNKFPDRPGFRMLVQLEEIIAESFSMMVKSQKVQTEYERMVKNIDTELKILTKTPIDLIAMGSNERIAEGIKKVREGDLLIVPGFDNTYGKVQIWKEDDTKVKENSKNDQISLL